LFDTECVNALALCNADSQKSRGFAFFDRDIVQALAFCNADSQMSRAFTFFDAEIDNALAFCNADRGFWIQEFAMPLHYAKSLFYRN
jgi:hypothetical protein